MWQSKKNEYTCGKNISRICLENALRLQINLSKKISNNPLVIKLGRFTQELDVVLTKIKNRKAAGLDEIPPEVWKTRKFDYSLLRYCNTVFSQNTIERWTKACILPFPKKGDHGIAKN